MIYFNNNDAEVVHYFELMHFTNKRNRNGSQRRELSALFKGAVYNCHLKKTTVHMYLFKLIYNYLKYAKKNCLFKNTSTLSCPREAQSTAPKASALSHSPLKVRHSMPSVSRKGR